MGDGPSGDGSAAVTELSRSRRCRCRAKSLELKCTSFATLYHHTPLEFGLNEEQHKHTFAHMT